MIAWNDSMIKLCQWGGIMVSKEHKYPKGKNEDDFPDGMVGDFQMPDLVCTNC